MSLIHTCEFNDVNAFDYLTESRLASTSSFSASQLGATISHRTGGVVERAAAETATGSKKDIRLSRPLRNPRVRKNKLAREEIVPARTLTLPITRLPCGPLSEMPVYHSRSRRQPGLATVGKRLATQAGATSGQLPDGRPSIPNRPNCPGSHVMTVTPGSSV